MITVDSIANTSPNKGFRLNTVPKKNTSFLGVKSNEFLHLTWEALRGQDLVTGDVVDSVVTLAANHKSIGVPRKSQISPSLKRPHRFPWKLDSWKLEDDPFLLGLGPFSGAMLVYPRGTFQKIMVMISSNTL